MQQPEGFCQPSVEEIILEHGVTSTDQKLVCSLAMVSRDWSAAVLKAPISRLHVALVTPDIPDLSANGLPGQLVTFASSFAQWYSKHAQMVSRLQINNEKFVDKRTKQWLEAVLVPALSEALRAAATCPQVGAEWQLRPLGLQSYSSCTFNDSAVLQALPAASLTRLDIFGGSASALAAAVIRLTSLQNVSSSWVIGGLDGYVAALAQLSRLTSLTLSSYESEGNVDCQFVNQLPSQLLRLDLDFGYVKESDMVDLSHLTRLTSCKLEVNGSAGSQSWRFPTQLVELSLCHASGEGDRTSSAFNISSLMQLQHLWLGGTTVTPEDLLQVGKLPNLQSLALNYILRNEEKIKAAAPIWQRLKELQSLQVVLCNREEAASLDWAQQLVSVSGLKQLLVHSYCQVQHQDLAAFCQEVAKLRLLQQLLIFAPEHVDPWAQSDSRYAIQHLSCLTQLTRLELSGAAGRLCHDEVTMKLALSMKQLRKLRVPVKSSIVFKAIGELKYLEYLSVPQLPAAEQQTGLQHLQGLKRLTKLEGFEECSKDA